MRRLLFILFCLYFHLLQGAETLTFNKLTDLSSFEPESVRTALSDYLNKEIHIRGFVYQNDRGQYVLSSKPDLASCCQKKQENIPHQIFLEGTEFSSSGGKTIAVQGFLTLNPVRDVEGRLIELYRLKEPKILTINNSTTWSLLALMVGIVFLVLISFGRRRSSH